MSEAISSINGVFTLRNGVSFSLTKDFKVDWCRIFENPSATTHLYFYSLHWVGQLVLLSISNKDRVLLDRACNIVGSFLNLLKPMRIGYLLQLTEGGGAGIMALRFELGYF